MKRRSRGVAGRPIGRPAAPLGFLLHTVAALIAMVAIGAPAVLLSAGSAAAQAGDATTDSSPPPPAEPQSSAGSDAPASDPAPPPAPQWQGSTAYDVPPSAAAPGTGESSPNGGADKGTAPADGSPGPSQPADGVGAHNQSTVLQAIVQVQVGCHTYCHGTSQDQSASQGSDTKQDATAVAPGGSGASAVNQSTTYQFIWQTQLGCVAFCWDTTMNQSASQDAQTTQDATAVSDVAARAVNAAGTFQHVWQHQEGCTVECHGVSASQSLSQSQRTDQSAKATGPDWAKDASSGVPSWLTAFAESIGATIQTIFQYQEATCLDHCGEAALQQEAAQLAATTQTGAAGDIPPAPPDPAGPPQAPPPAGQPPASRPAPASAAAVPSERAPAAKPKRRAGHGGSKRQRLDQGAPQHSMPSPAATPRGGQPTGPGVLTRHRPAGSSKPGGGNTAVSPTSAGSPAAVTLDPRPGERGGGSDFPWLPAGFLAVAAIAAILGLRDRRPLGA